MNTWKLFQPTFFRRSLASWVRYGGRLSLHFRILSMVFLRFSPVNGGYNQAVRRRQMSPVNRDGSKPDLECRKLVEEQALTAPVSMSYMSAPKLHQSTALLWPLRIRISGALTGGGGGGGKVRTPSTGSSLLRLRRLRGPIQTTLFFLWRTCIQWCHRRCVWRFHHGWTPCRGQSPLTSHVLQKETWEQEQTIEQINKEPI